MTAQRFSTMFLLLLALLALPAAAQAADERAAAKRFADAALRTKVAINAQRPEIQRRAEALGSTFCSNVVERAPRRAAEGIERVFIAGFFGVLYTPTLPALQQMVADLDAVPTADRALRSGRAAWRATVEVIVSAPRLDDPCGVLDAWRKAGWSREAAPKAPGLARTLVADNGRVLARKLRRAERRLRRLGVSPGAARRFRGDTLYSDVEGLFDETVTEESSTSSPGG